MKIVTDIPSGLPDTDFVLMGVISDSDIDYACLLQHSTKNMFIEEIHWGRGKNIFTATLHQVNNDEEWITLFRFVTKCTTIFSPKKVNDVLKQPELYFYRSEYKKSEDYLKRKKRETL